MKIRKPCDSCRSSRHPAYDLAAQPSSHPAISKIRRRFASLEDPWMLITCLSGESMPCKAHQSPRLPAVLGVLSSDRVERYSVLPCC